MNATRSRILSSWLPPVAAAALVCATTLSASAAVVTVLPSSPDWANPVGENNTGGSSAITGTMPRSVGETGSLELNGGRTRFFGLGNPYSSLSNLGKLSDVIALTFDWMIAVGSTNPYNADYTPALRLHIWDGNQRSELIWEGEQNGTYGNTSAGQWYSSGSADKFWRFQDGPGVTFQPIGRAQVYTSIFDWSNGSANDGSDWYSDNAYVAAVSVGAGGGATANYKAFADNVRFNIGGNDRTFNFELRGTSAVSEPGSIALALMAGLAAVAASRRKNRA